MSKKKNPYLKSANQEEEYTYEQIEELKKCFKDPVHFIRKYVRIVHPTQGTVPFDLFDYQEKMIKSFHRQQYTIVLSARQTGKCITEDTNVRIVNRQNIPFYKKWILRLLDKETYGRLYQTV